MSLLAFYLKIESLVVWVLAIWSASSLYGNNRFNAVIWVIMCRVVYATMTIWRAKFIFRQSKARISQHDRPRHEVMELHQFRKEAKQYFALHSPAIEAAGFRPLVCFTNHAFAGGPGEINCNVVFADSKNTTLVSLTYVRKARWFFVEVPLARFTGHTFSARIIESYIDGPGRIVVTDLELARPLMKRPLHFITIVEKTADFAELLELHRAAVSQVEAQGYIPQVVDCTDEYFEWDARFRHSSKRHLEQQLQKSIDQSGLDFIAPE